MTLAWRRTPGPSRLRAPQIADGVGKDGERLGQIDALDDDAVRDVQLHVREVPDAADAGRNQRVRAFLRRGGRNRQDAERHAQPLRDARQFGDGTDRHAVARRSGKGGIGVESRDDRQVLLAEAAVSEKRVPQRPHADEDGVRRIVPSQRAVHRLLERVRRIAAPRRPRHAGHRQVLARENGVEAELSGDDRARDVRLAGRDHLLDAAQIGRIALNRRQRKRVGGFRFAHAH